MNGKSLKELGKGQNLPIHIALLVYEHIDEVGNKLRPVWIMPTVRGKLRMDSLREVLSKILLNNCNQCRCNSSRWYYRCLSRYSVRE